MDEEYRGQDNEHPLGSGEGLVQSRDSTYAADNGEKASTG